MTRPNLSKPIRIWALLGARAGDNDQVMALAETLGLPFETKQLAYNGWRHLGPHILGSSLLSLSGTSRDEILAEQPPDLTISAGHRSVAVVRALQRLGGGRTRSIHVGFPRVSARHFDLVITTPQYAIRDHPNVLHLPYALTRAAKAPSDRADGPELAQLPHPHRLLIVGGPTLFWKMDEAALLTSLRELMDDAKANGGSVIVTTSPRTASDLREQITIALRSSNVPHLLAEPKKQPSYSSLLAAADSIRITADSVAMVSDAIWTGKPVGLVPVAKSALGQGLMGLVDAVRPGHRIYPQDLRFFWRALADIGVTDKLAVPRTSTKDVMGMVMHRLRPILEALR